MPYPDDISEVIAARGREIYQPLRDKFESIVKRKNKETLSSLG